VAAVTEHIGRAWREGAWWVVDVEGIGATQAKTLDKVDHMARALVADYLDVPYASVTVAVAIDLPDDVAQHIEDMKATAERAAQLSREAAEMQRHLVDSLRREELTGREIAVILNVTPGRVSQITTGRGADAGRVLKSKPQGRPGRNAKQSA
jgi:predicted XRE-type DNA-binding protein